MIGPKHNAHLARQSVIKRRQNLDEIYKCVNAHYLSILNQVTNRQLIKTTGPPRRLSHAPETA